MSKWERGKHDDDVLQNIIEIGDILGLFPFLIWEAIRRKWVSDFEVVEQV